MNVLYISHSHELTAIKQQRAPFACLLRDDCYCDASHFQNSHCLRIAIVGRGVSAVRRSKHLLEHQLSRQYGCPVRLFKDEDSAQHWLMKHVQVAMR